MSSSRLRPATASDAEQIAALYTATYGSVRLVDAEEVKTWLGNASIQPEWLRVLEVAGNVVGYGDVWIEHDEIALDLAAPGFSDELVDWAEETGREAGVIRARVWLPHGHELQAVLEARGYEFWRASFTMEIDLPERPVVPALPDGLELRMYRDEDEVALRRHLNAAFSQDPFWRTVNEENFRQFYLGRREWDRELWLLAWSGEALAGCVLCDPRRGADAGLGWVQILAVAESWRGQGLGRGLILSGFTLLHDRGRRRVGLGVNAENPTGALKLYERVGMRCVSRNDNWVKAL